MSYTDEAQDLREHYVPEEGQAATVQGELLRAIDTLRSEAQQNGNAGRTDDHAILVDFLGEILLDGGMFEQQLREQLEFDLEGIARIDPPETSNAPYDRVVERIVDWARLHPDLMPHHPNPALTI